MNAKDKPLTASDADISAEAIVSRRSLLGTISIGAGVAAAAVFGATMPAETAVVNRHIGDVIGGSPAPKTQKKKSFKTSAPPPPPRRRRVR
jgi:hypothetical protein